MIAGNEPKMKIGYNIVNNSNTKLKLAMLCCFLEPQSNCMLCQRMYLYKFCKAMHSETDCEQYQRVRA